MLNSKNIKQMQYEIKVLMRFHPGNQNLGILSGEIASLVSKLLEKSDISDELPKKNYITLLNQWKLYFDTHTFKVKEMIWNAQLIIVSLINIGGKQYFVMCGN